MRFSILNPVLACSSLVLGVLNEYQRSPGLSYFAKDPDGWMDTFAKKWCCELVPSSALRPRAMSFVFVSTIRSQSVAVKCLKELGFWHSPSQKNTKNGTSPTAWVATKDQIDAALIRLGYDLKTGKKGTSV